MVMICSVPVCRLPACDEWSGEPNYPESDLLPHLSIQMSAPDPHRQTVDGTGGLNVTNDLTFILGSPVPRLSHAGDVALAIGGDIGAEVIWRHVRLVSSPSNTC